MVAFCAIIGPTIAKIGMPSASGDFVKADKERTPEGWGQVGFAKLFDLSRQGTWSV